MAPFRKALLCPRGRATILCKLKRAARQQQTQATRLAKQYSLDADLMAFAIKARPSLMIDCAAYFEQRGEFEKAVQLYQKGGDVAKALDICFKAGADGCATVGRGDQYVEAESPPRWVPTRQPVDDPNVSDHGPG